MLDERRGDPFRRRLVDEEIARVLLRVGGRPLTRTVAGVSLARPLTGIGVGASFIDGLLRFDFSRATRAPTGWRLDFYTDAAL